jgi:hypothetical protein
MSTTPPPEPPDIPRLTEVGEVDQVARMNAMAEAHGIEFELPDITAGQRTYYARRAGELLASDTDLRRLLDDVEHLLGG